MDAHGKERLFPVNDPVLHPLIEARNECERQHAMEALIGQEATPIIDGILGRSSGTTLRRHDLDDVCSSVVLRLVRRLSEIPSAIDQAITNFDDFVAQLTYNAVHDVYRHRFPERTRLKNRLRYVLTRDARFELWLADAGSAGGLAAWRGRGDYVRNADLAPHEMRKAVLDRAAIGDALATLFRHFGRPLLLDDAVRILAEAWGISDAAPGDAPEGETGMSPFEQLASREQLCALWREIAALPERQRAALLLNLRDPHGGNAAALFVLTGVIGIDDLAAAVTMRVEELAAIWSELPIDDLAIASRLGITRQQVINLRKSARERLVRRLKP